MAGALQVVTSELQERVDDHTDCQKKDEGQNEDGAAIIRFVPPAAAL
jgi:hypothetical protein